MKELLIILAKAMPEEMIIEKIIEHAVKYKDGDKEQRHHLEVACQLLLTKSTFEGKEAMDAIADIQRIEDLAKLADLKKQ